MFILGISAVLLDAVNISAFLYFRLCLWSMAKRTSVHTVVAVVVQFFKSLLSLIKKMTRKYNSKKGKILS